MLKIYISTILVATTIFLYSCEIKQSDTNTITNKTDSIKHEPFKGFGELIVDTPFEKVSNYKKFKKNGNIYSLEKYEISKEIGVVEFVEVELYDGLIYKVKFCNGPFTKDFYFKINDTIISSGYNKDTYIDYSYIPKNNDIVVVEEAGADAIYFGHPDFTNEFVLFHDEALSYSQMKFLTSIPKPKFFKNDFTSGYDIYNSNSGITYRISKEDMNRNSWQFEISYESLLIKDRIKRDNDSLNKVQYMQDVVK
jgi:hypothetical protein